MGNCHEIAERISSVLMTKYGFILLRGGWKRSETICQFKSVGEEFPLTTIRNPQAKPVVR